MEEKNFSILFLGSQTSKMCALLSMKSEFFLFVQSNFLAKVFVEKIFYCLDFMIGKNIYKREEEKERGREWKIVVVKMLSAV